MKTVDLTATPQTAEELLDLASKDNRLLMGSKDWPVTFRESAASTLEVERFIGAFPEC